MIPQVTVTQSRSHRGAHEPRDRAVWVPAFAGTTIRQFNTRLPSGLSSEKAGTSISKRSPVSLTIW